jgi:hypothetical protein
VERLINLLVILPEGELIGVLAIDHPDWTIPWAGLGALLLGIGGTLSGIAALITARNRGRDEGTAPTTVSRSGNDGRSGISDSDSDESGFSSVENSDD